MLAKVRKTIGAFRMLGPGERVLVGVSGGADSVALLAALHRLAPALGVTLSAAHFNHGTRAGESDRDESFVRRLCGSLGIGLLTGSMATDKRRAGLSLEDFLRRKRYAFFESARRQAGADRIALGHHRGDQAETVLLHLIRGSGLSGLAGIPPVRDGGRIIRPLINCSPGEIIAYCRREGLSFVTDSSNADERFLRNRIRRVLLPDLERRFNPAIVDSLCRLADVVRQEDDYMREEARAALETLASGPSTSVIPIDKLDALHPAIKRRIIREIVRGFAGPDAAVGLDHVQAVLELAAGEGPSGTRVLPGGTRARRVYGRLEFQSGAGRGGTAREGAPLTFCQAVPIPGTVGVEMLGLRVRFRELRRPPSRPETTPRRAYLDLERIDGPLVLRSPRPGDRIQPLGMKGTRKLSRLLIDEKVPRDRRSRIPVLADDLSVLWVPGLRLSERARVTGGTRRVLKAEII